MDDGHIESPWARLSREVADSILDALWSDIGALQASSLVCRHWTPRCQLNLLYDVRIRGQERINEFLRAITTFSERARPLFTVVRLLGSLTESPNNTTISREQFVFILDNLPCVNHVVFRHIALDIGPDRSTPFAQRTIDTLVFVDITGSPDQRATPIALAMFINLFHSIRFLSLFRAKLEDSALWAVAPSGEPHLLLAQHGISFPPCLRIEELILTASQMELSSILSFLRHSGVVRSLRVIRVTIFDQAGLISLAKFLKDKPEQIEQLKLFPIYHVTEFTSFGFPELGLDASRFTSLHTVVLGCAIRTWVPDASFESCNSMLALIELLADAPSLRQLEMNVSVRWNTEGGRASAHLENLDDMPERGTPDFALELVYDVPWGRLEALLQYASLEVVVVSIYKSIDDWYTPEDYMVPILNCLPWPEDSEDVELIKIVSFWEDSDIVLDMENVLAS